jgi:hypothetical protein
MTGACAGCPQQALYDAAREILYRYKDQHESPDESAALIDFNETAFKVTADYMHCPGQQLDKDQDLSCPVAQTAINAQISALVRPNLSSYAVKLSELVSADDKPKEHGQYL